MNQHFQNILDIIQQDGNLRAEEIKLTKFLEEADKEFQAKNYELEIESSLERVRTVALKMSKPDDLLNICEVLFNELKQLGFNELRNALIHTFVDEENYFNDYDYSDFSGGCISRIPYSGHPVIDRFIEVIRKANDAFIEIKITGRELEEWKSFRKSNKEADDPRLDNIDSLYYYIYSVGAAGIGISTFQNVSIEKQNILRRFRNAFDLAYKRYLDITQAEAQAREAKVEAALERVRTKTMAMHNSEQLAETTKVFFEQFKLLGNIPDRMSIGIINEESKKVELWVTDQSGNQVNNEYFFAIDERTSIAKIFGAWKERKDTFIVDLTGSDLEEWLRFVKEEARLPIDETQIKGRRVQQAAFFSKGFLLFTTHEPVADEIMQLLVRFARVFDLTYTRFLDLQKAESQAKEAQIELGLERVRARAMAMQKSDELAEVANLLFQQVQALGLPVVSSGYNIWEKEGKVCTAWMSDQSGLIQPSFKMPLTESPMIIHFHNSHESGESFYAEEVSGEALAAHYRYMLTLPVFDKIIDKFLQAGFTLPTYQVNNVANFSHGNLIFITYKPVPEAHDIFKRFAKVFEQTYTRFLDLQKAEAQAREAQIELGLERVRARAMAMQKSDELKELIGTVFTELTKLNFALTRCVIMIYDQTKGSTWWMANSEAPSDPISLYVKYHELPVNLAYMKAWQERKLKWQYILEGTVKKNWDAFLFVETELSQLPDFVIAGMKAPDRVYLNASFNSFGNLTLATLEPLSNEDADILLRFAKVFDLTYTRFNDLQKAEAQAREAKIEAALERVRAQTMAMHSSEDVSAATATMFTELEKAGVENVRCGIAIVHENKMMEVWSITNVDDKKTLGVAGAFDMNAHKVWQLFFDAWYSKTDYITYFLSGKEKEDYVAILNKTSHYLSQPIREMPDMNFQSYQFKEGAIWSFSMKPHNEEEQQIMKRFVSVFSLTFRRFLDLQKAEAQAREAKIEAALERVRSKAMAMQKSDDLANAVAIIFEELDKLKLETMRCGIGIINKEKRSVNVWTTAKSDENRPIQISGDQPMDSHPLLRGAFNAWLQQEEYSYTLQGEDLRNYYKSQLAANFILPESHSANEELCQYYFLATFQAGGLFAFRETPFPGEAKTVIKRFADVFNLTYTRFNDIKKAEAQAREAVRASSLDRVRAETASMRTTGDLEKITPLIWNELTTLGVPFIRCGVFIMDEQQEQIHSFLSTPDGKAIAAFQLPYDSAGELSNVLTHWQKKEIYKDHWNEAKFAAWTKSLVEQGAIASEEKYATPNRPVNLYLHFLPFLQGMLYVGSEAPLRNDEINLVQTLADAFSTAYARYEDFNKLESAKAQIEKTLVDLKQAQAQLIQSEKMASLGELTAGIAHEIQNPLNFINNFSEVNKELITEMKEEIEKGNYDEVNALANDVIDNEQKINHHGKRADAIVKGMLQHSRKSSGQKEATNINALTDEYLRLSYHGLRAKDKSFYATMKTDFDETIGKVNLIAQDVGRVLLNLFDNAFYAVSEKQKAKSRMQNAHSKQYEPTVSVSTKKSAENVEICVEDNGGGIPQNIIDKIFQPFFTTKPTGEGTGLGLSLSYDIIKAHGGTLKVENLSASKEIDQNEAEGTKFMITLPI